MARKDVAIAARARKAVEKWRQDFKFNIDLYHQMHTFILGQQWTDDEQQEMVKTFRKTPLTSNKLATLSNTLLGEQQLNTPQLQVVPMEDCDEQVAQIREILTKDIMFSSDAKTVRQIAASQAAIGGFGAYCVDTDYEYAMSFDLSIKYRSFKDSTRSYFDISAEEKSKIDGMHAGYISRVSRKKFAQLHGKELEEKISKVNKPTADEEEIALAVEPTDGGDDPFTWADNDAITVIHHYERKYTKDTLYKLSNARSVNQEELDEIIEKSHKRHEKEAMQSMLLSNDINSNMISNDNNMGQSPEGIQGQEQMQESMQPEQPMPTMQQPTDEEIVLYDGDEPVRIEGKKSIKRCKIMHYEIAGDYILDEGEFPSEDLPVIFVDQNSYYEKNGKQVCRSFFGDAKDTQRYINYLRTQSAYILKISRYDQFMGSKKNVQSLDTQRDWKDPSNTKGLIAYDESPQGHKPEQLRPPELSQSLLSQYELAVNDLYSSTGLYPSRLGEQGNETSGVAIDARTRQGSYPTFIFFNSINRAIEAEGRIVNQMIPRVYDSERALSLMMPDEGMKNIVINKQADEYGELIENDIRKGTYQVRLLPGPSWEGQKEQALASLKDVIQTDPDTFKLIADLYADNLPLPNNIEIKNRLKTLVPPQIIEAGKTGKVPQQQGQPDPQQQVMQMQMQMQQQEMQLKAKEIEIKEQEVMIKKQQILLDAQYKMQELENERLQSAAQIKEQELRYMAETQRTETDAGIAHADNLVKILTHKVPDAL